MRIVTLGDLLLDVVVRLDTALVPGDDQPAAHEHRARAARRRTSPRGRRRSAPRRRSSAGVGADAAGELVLRELERSAASTYRGPVAGRTGVVVSIAAAGDRTMASDRGTAPELAPHDLEPAWFDCDVLHISGYALLREPIASRRSGRGRSRARTRRARSRSTSRRGRSSTTRSARASRRSRPSSCSRPSASRTRSARSTTRWVLKRGARGLSVDGVDYPAVDVEVVDTTGAGDALAAGFLVGGAELGTATAARCCAQMGAMP